MPSSENTRNAIRLSVTLPCSSTDGYQNFGHGLCLKIHTEHTTWEDARARCLQEHADLVVLDTKEKSDTLNAYLDANEKSKLCYEMGVILNILMTIYLC